jgi:hypothetical protein
MAELATDDFNGFQACFGLGVIEVGCSRIAQLLPRHAAHHLGLSSASVVKTGSPDVYGRPVCQARAVCCDHLGVHHIGRWLKSVRVLAGPYRSSLRMKKLVGLDTERYGEALKVIQGDVTCAALNVRNERPMKSSLKGQKLLRPISLPAQRHEVRCQDSTSTRALAVLCCCARSHHKQSWLKPLLSQPRLRHNLSLRPLALGMPG